MRKQPTTDPTERVELLVHDVSETIEDLGRAREALRTAAVAVLETIPPDAVSIEAEDLTVLKSLGEAHLRVDQARWKLENGPDAVQLVTRISEAGGIPRTTEGAATA